jgi:hypothetical protein
MTRHSFRPLATLLEGRVFPSALGGSFGIEAAKKAPPLKGTLTGTGTTFDASPVELSFQVRGKLGTILVSGKGSLSELDSAPDQNYLQLAKNAKNSLHLVALGTPVHQLGSKSPILVNMMVDEASGVFAPDVDEFVDVIIASRKGKDAISVTLATTHRAG